jgi:iron complex transport system permease protein
MIRAFVPSFLAIPGTIRWPRAGSIPAVGLPFALACALGVAIIAGVGWGTVPIGPVLVARVIGAHLGLGDATADWTAAQDAIVWQVRLPRVIGAVLAGAALATSGALFQGLFRNPMADPFVLGISSGAALGATLALLVGPATGLAAIGIQAVTAAGLQAMLVPTAGAVGAVATAFVVFRIARRGAGFLLTDLLLAGFAVGSMLTAATTAVLVLNDQMAIRLRLVFSWLAGGIAVNGWGHLGVAAPVVMLCLAVAYGLARWLDPLVLGEAGAKSVGVPVAMTIRVTLATGAVLAASAVTLGGLIGFVGLLVPHMLRRLTGPSHRRLLPACAFGGGAFLVIADLLARVVLAPVELPVGILTAMVGGPAFLAVLRRARRAC